MNLPEKVKYQDYLDKVYPKYRRFAGDDQKKISELMGQLEHVKKQAAEAEGDNPEVLVILPDEVVKEMQETDVVKVVEDKVDKLIKMVGAVMGSVASIAKKVDAKAPSAYGYPASTPKKEDETKKDAEPTPEETEKPAEEKPEVEKTEDEKSEEAKVEETQKIEEDTSLWPSDFNTVPQDL